MSSASSASSASSPPNPETSFQGKNSSSSKPRKRRRENETTAHRSQEKKRRQLINKSIVRLKELVPKAQGKRTTIINVLQATEEYVEEMQAQQAAMQAELDRMRALVSARGGVPSMPPVSQVQGVPLHGAAEEPPQLPMAMSDAPLRGAKSNSGSPSPSAYMPHPVDPVVVGMPVETLPVSVAPLPVSVAPLPPPPISPQELRAALHKAQAPVSPMFRAPLPPKPFQPLAGGGSFLDTMGPSVDGLFLSPAHDPLALSPYTSFL